ncbi:hypothetical protein Gpo141_00004337 [Globisporangium polare]
MTTSPLSESETETEQWRTAKFARVHCVRRRSRSPSPVSAASPRRPCERVRRLVRRKQPSKQRVMPVNAVPQGATFSAVATADAERMSVFEFQPGVPEAPTIDFFCGDYGQSDADGGDEETDSLEAVMEQHKWRLHDRVRDKLLEAPRKVHRSLA